MIKLRKSNDRGAANHGWLDTRFTFSFADYHDPQHMGFRSLRVINDDRIAPGGGFDTHPHRDMEIITYMLSGALEHKDSMGNGRVIRPGEFQYMAAGTGVFHSEFNPSSDTPAHLLQIWIHPDKRGYEPRYAERDMKQSETGVLHLVASKTGRDGSFEINQDTDLYLARLQSGDKVVHELKPRRHAWIQVAEGEVGLNGMTLNSGDGAAVSDEEVLTFNGKGDAQVLMFDMN
jgi:redox-sensitive bicupin YhaK (pirin superfamily)